nr:glycerol-3-phosphate acyltransferase [Bacilli bacterium]
MNIFYNILSALFCLILGYFFGSIPTAVWIGKAFFHRDPRLEGSKNAGGTNAGRLFGKKIGVLVIFLDMLKLILPMYLCFLMFTYIKFGNSPLCPKPEEFDQFGLNYHYIVGWPVYWLAVVGCVVGHCWPFFASFKGGKGVSCYMGTVCASTWMLGLIPGLTYFLFLKITKKVSLTSIIVSILITVVTWVWIILFMLGVIPTNL